MATYEVSSSGNNANSGTFGASPWRTIGYGVSRLSRGDVLYIRGGTYNSSSDRIQGIDFATSGTSWDDAPTIAGYPGETVTMNCGAQPVHFYGVSRSYIKIENIVFDGINLGFVGDAVVFIDVGDHIRLDGCTVKRAPGHSCLVAGNYIEFLNGLVDTNNRLNTGGPQVGNGWYGAGNYHLIRNSEFRNMGAGCVRFMDSGGTLKTGCLADKIRGHAFSLNAPAAGFGVLLGGSGNRAVNCEFWNGAGPALWAFQSIAGGSGAEFDHCSVSGITSHGALVSPGMSGTLFKNVLIHNCSVNYEDNGSGTVVTTSIKNGTDPLFTSPSTGDFSLQPGSPALNTGTNIGVLEDSQGFARPFGPAVDMGSRESGSTTPATPPDPEEPPPTPPPSDPVVSWSTTGMKSWPSAASGVTLTPSGTSFGNSAWVQVGTATAASFICGVTCIASIDSVSAQNREWEIDVGIGASGSEVSIGTFKSGSRRGSRDNERHGRVMTSIPFGGVTAGARVSVRMRKTGTNTSAFTGVSVLYLEEPVSGSVQTTMQPLRAYPSAGNVVAVNIGASWANPASWTQLIASLSNDIAIVNIPYNLPSGEFELDLGVGGSGSETVVTTIRGYNEQQFSGCTYIHLPNPLAAYTAGQRVSARARSSATFPLAFAIGLNYFHRPL